MSGCNRRQWLASLAAATAESSMMVRAQRPGHTENEQRKTTLALEDYQPKSMLHVPETKVPRARFAVIDIHTHLSWTDRTGNIEKARFNATPDEVLPVMDRKNVRLMVNLTGGYGAALDENIHYWQRPYPKRFIIFTEPWFNRIIEPSYAKFQADQIERASKIGAKGLKVTKTLGLYLREQVTTERLIKVDDRRFDAMWEAAGANKMPIAIHTSDPEAFFLPIDRFNERFEALNVHPDWSFHGKDYPSNQELQEARNRVLERHPRTQFVVLHVGVAENLDYIYECMDRYPNMHVEIGARIGELGRQPRMALKFLISTRTAFSLAQMPYRRAWKHRSRYSAKSYMKSTTASWRPRTSISITPRRPNRRKDIGVFTASVCRKASCANSIMKTPHGYWG